MKNYQKILIIFALVMVLGACGAKIETEMTTDEPEAMDVMDDAMQAEETEEVEVEVEEPAPEAEAAAHSETTTPETEEAPAAESSNQASVSITSGTASYTAQKEWLSKPTDAVVGSTSGVSGTLNVADGVASVTASIDSQTFASGSGGRDKEVAQMFNGPISISGSGIAVGDTSATLAITINGVTKNVTFSTNIAETSTAFTASGSGSVSLATFGIDAPSIAGVYSVGDSIGVSFDVTASK